MLEAKGKFMLDMFFIFYIMYILYCFFAHSVLVTFNLIAHVDSDNKDILFYSIVYQAITHT